MSLRREARLLEAAATNPRPQPMVIETFEAFHLKESGEPVSDYRGEPVVTCSGATLQECVDAAAPRCSHKAQFAVRHSDTRTGAVVLHIYQVRQQAKAKHVYRDFQTTRVQPLYAEKVASVRIDQLVRA